MIHWTGALAGMRNEAVPWAFAEPTTMLEYEATTSTAAPGTGPVAGSITRTRISRLGFSTILTGCFVSVSFSES